VVIEESTKCNYEAKMNRPRLIHRAGGAFKISKKV